MKQQPSRHDPFGEISIDRPDATGVGEPPQPLRGPRRPHFSRQAVPPKSKTPFPTGPVLTLLGIAAMLYLACGFIVVPHLIKTFGTHALARYLGRPITIGQVEFDPLRLRLTLTNGIIGPLVSDPSDTVDPILSFSRLTVDLEAASLSRRALICQELSLDQPFLHLVHDTGNRYNITTLAPPAANTHPAWAWLLTSAINRYSINNISLNSGEVRYDDRLTAKTHRLEEITLSLPAIENIPYHSGGLQPRLAARVNGTPITMAGQTTQPQQGPTSARMNFTMKNLDLAAYTEYLPREIGIHSLGGQADLDLELLYDATHAEKLRLIGEVSLRSLQGSGSQGQLKADTGRIKGWLAPMSKQFHADALTLAHPVWQRATAGAPPWRLLAAALIQSDPRQQGAIPISLLQINNGEILSPAGSSPEPATEWKGIDASINSAHSSDGPEQAFFSLNARAASGSRLSIQGSAGGTPFIAKGMMIANTIDVLAMQGLLQATGLRLPVASGSIDQVQTNFEVALGPEQHLDLHLEPLAIQAKNLRIELNNQTLDIPVWHSEQGAFTLHEPTLHLGKVRAQQAKLVCRRASATAAWQTLLSTPDDQSAPLPALDLTGLELTNSSLLIENQGPPDITLRLERFDLQTDQIAPGQPASLTMTGMLEDKYPLQATGAFSLAPFTASLAIQANDIPLAMFQPILDRYFVRPGKGLLSFDGTLALPALDYKGAWAITGLTAPPFSCRKVEAEETEIRLRPLSLAIGRLNLDSPALQVSASENGLPILPSLFQAGWQPGPSPDKAAVAIKSIHINDGTLIYDFPGPPGITLNHSKIKGTLSDCIVAREQAIPFTLTGQMESSGEFQVEGAIRPFATPPGMTVNSKVEGVPLASLAAIIEPYWGFTIKEGTLGFANEMTFENSVIHDQSRLTMTGLKLGKPLAAQAIKAHGTTWENLPLIQALLQDNDGFISLTVPIDGRTDSGFTYLEGMKGFLNQLLLKAAVSPLSLLGAEQKTIVEGVDFGAGSSQLTPAMEERLQPLAAFLTRHPLTAIRLAGSSDSADQKALLRPPKGPAKSPPAGEALQQLAAQRTQAVLAFLIAQGAPAAAIEQADSAPPSQTPQKTPDRRVTISVTVAK